MRLTSGQNTIDPLTGLPVVLGQVRVTQDGQIRTTQATGTPVASLNQSPGVIPVNPSAPGNADPGLPRAYVQVPVTGPLT